MEKLDWLADRDAKALSAVVYEILSNSLSEFGNKTAPTPPHLKSNKQANEQIDK